MKISDSTDDMRGNVVFYYHYGPSAWQKFWERMVATKTHGPYVHCEIVYDHTDAGWRTIGAMNNGIDYGMIPSDKTQYALCTIQTVSVDETGHVIPIERTKLEEALAWAHAHLKTPYGMIDNVDQALDILFPGNTIHLSQQDRYNCSNFVAAFMDKAGIRLPRSFTYPFNVSPNDLAEWFGLLPQRKRIIR